MNIHLTSRDRIVWSYAGQSVAAQSIVHIKFLLKTFPGKDQAWKSINGFSVSFTSSFDQLKF